MTGDEAEALRLDILTDASDRFRRWRARAPKEEVERSSMSPDQRAAAAELAAELEAMHEANVQRHGATRATLARWTALLRLSEYLMRAEARRRERALLEATEALERAQAAEQGEARWLRVSCWIARRVDEAAQRMGRRTKVVTRIDFSQSTELATFGESLEADDIKTTEEDGEIPW